MIPLSPEPKNLDPKRPAKVKIFSFDGNTVEFDFDEHRLKTGPKCAGLLIKISEHRWHRIATPGEIALPDDDEKVITALLNRYPHKIREFIDRNACTELPTGYLGYQDFMAELD